MQEQNQQNTSNNEPGQKFGNGTDKTNKGLADAGASALETAKSTSMDLLEKAKSTAGEAYGSVTEKATSKLEEGKVGLSGGLSSVADSMRKVAGGLNDSPETSTVADYSARYAETAAQKLESVADYFETKDIAAITRDVESFARRNTAIFLGAAFALGILAARFIKSSSAGEVSSSDNSGSRKLASKRSGGGSTAGDDGIKGIETDSAATPAASRGREAGAPDPGLESSARGV